MKNKRRRKSHDSLPKVAISCVFRADVLDRNRKWTKKNRAISKRIYRLVYDFGDARKKRVREKDA